MYKKKYMLYLVIFLIGIEVKLVFCVFGIESESVFVILLDKK